MDSSLDYFYMFYYFFIYRNNFISFRIYLPLQGSFLVQKPILLSDIISTVKRGLNKYLGYVKVVSKYKLNCSQGL